MMALKKSDKIFGYRFSEIFGSKIYCRLLIALSQADLLSAKELHTRTRYSLPKILSSLNYLTSIDIVDRIGDSYTIGSKKLKRLLQELQRCLDDGE